MLFLELIINFEIIKVFTEINCFNMFTLVLTDFSSFSG